MINDSGLTCLYSAENHDWHYEGLPSSDAQLRHEWTQKCLLPLFQGKNPLMAVTEIKEVRFVTIDNSIYQISAEQLDFFREQVNTRKPLVLIVHIPLYFEGASYIEGQYGHPTWGGPLIPTGKLNVANTAPPRSKYRPYYFNGHYSHNS